MLSWEVAEQRTIRDKVLSGSVSKDVVNASGSLTLSAAVPVLILAVSRGAGVREAFSHVGPSLAGHLDQKGRMVNVDVGIHADEIWRMANSSRSFPNLAKEAGVVGPSLGVNRRDVDARLFGSASRTADAVDVAKS